METAPLPLISCSLFSEQEGLANATKLGSREFGGFFCLVGWGFLSVKVPKLCVSVCIRPGSATAGQEVPTLTTAIPALCPLLVVGTVSLKSLRQIGL